MIDFDLMGSLKNEMIETKTEYTLHFISVKVEG